MTLGDDLLSITDRYDRELAKAGAATMARINAAYDASYRQLVDDLRRAYGNLQQAGSISALVRKGAILQELGDALEFINPNAPGQYRTAAEQLIQESVVLGEEMGGETLARLGTPQSTFTTIPIGAVRFQAESFTQRLVNYSTQQASQISAVVEQGLIQGWGVKKVEANLKGLGVSFKSNAETVARTEQMSAYNGAALNRYEQAGAKYLQWIAAPSERLCPTCGERNGKIYQIKDFPQIPAHPRCRCTSLAILNPEDVDTEFFKEYREEGLADLKAQGLKPDSGPTYWEKKAGLTSAPKPVWVPGQPLPKLERMEPLPAPVLTGQPVVSAPKPVPEVDYSKQIEAIENSQVSITRKIHKEWIEQNGMIPGDANIEEQTAIRVYSSSYYRAMNKLLRGQKETDWKAAEHAALNGFSEMAANGLKKMPGFEGTVYRGTQLPRKLQAQYKPGAIVQDAGFVSTSYDQDKAWVGNTQYVIQSKRGVNIESISANPGENEVLFPPNTKFRVLSVEKTKGEMTVYMEEYIDD